IVVELHAVAPLPGSKYAPPLVERMLNAAATSERIANAHKSLVRIAKGLDRRARLSLNDDCCTRHTHKQVMLKMLIMRLKDAGRAAQKVDQTPLGK
ncbi:MAG TPA: hypothetical protein VEL51_01280, partial [Vicinamibacterales bacterium]|nr:hypothetical protein [Vicinamibacterales bacterium]